MRKKKKKHNKKGAWHEFLKKFVPGTIFLFILCGCQTLPTRSSPTSPESAAGESTGQLDYINEAELVYATDIEDRGWELEDYRMETGDVLNISVWQVEDLRRTVVVRPDGKISFPLIGDIQAKGVTIDGLRNTLEEKLGKYIRVPQVSVIIEAFGGKRVIVIDESGGGGIIRFTKPIRMVETLAMAGGYDSDINLHKVYIIRGSMEKGKPTEIIVVNAHKIFREGDMSENILVHSDDIIFLARGWLSSVTNFVGKMDTLKSDVTKVITQAHYFRNIDNVAPWRTTATDIDMTNKQRGYEAGDWGLPGGTPGKE